MTAAPDALPYRPCVGIMLLNPDNLVFVGQRTDNESDAWQMPQGGIDPGEEPREAALRELKEEVGTDQAVILCESTGWHQYDLPTELIGQVWRGRYRGQRQKWFAMRFMGRDSDIDIHTHEAEFRSWRWLPLADLPAVIVPFKRQLYTDLVAEFAPLVLGRPAP
ncbi:MAG: RNA pyrophosphohydrolase [Alphaproteobacteria bacterium]|nr:RNA pyrophosphohydrolase [Alphaproteobacteria bacterium]